MIKKAVGFAVSAVLAFSSVTAFAAVDFSDLGNEHWAYPSVNTLVGEGTIKGYEDGSFKPNNTVTRAEFVKMIGKGEYKSEVEFKDVPASHWGYDYIMYSGLDGVDDNNFAPDRAITRGETIQLLWDRAGAEVAVAPDIITDQAYNKYAVAWVYTYGVMIGNDGINLRLEDTLSRAEAAALIIKSRNAKSPISFIDTVSDDYLKYVFDSLKLFDDTTYSPDKTITYAELSRAMQRYAGDEYNISYKKYYTQTPFEHEYAKDIFILGNEVLGKDIISIDYVDKKATIQDAVSAFAWASSRRAQKNITTPIRLYYNDEKSLSSPVTQKELTAILLQYDYIVGSQTAWLSGKDEHGFYATQNLSIKTDLLPSSPQKYQVITNDIPNEVYEYPFRIKEGLSGNDYGNPKAIYDFAREYSSLFMMQCDKLEIAALDKYGTKIKLTYYPHLVYDSGQGFTMRLKCEIISLGSQISTPEDLFDTSVITGANMKLQNGSTFFAEVNTLYSIFN